MIECVSEQGNALSALAQHQSVHKSNRYARPWALRSHPRVKEQVMGFFKKVENESGANKAAGAPVSTKNIALRVMSFDVEKGTTTGIDLNTGDELTIKLRSLGKTFDKQGGVAQWAKKGKYYVPTGENGGVIVFESVVRDKETNELTSRWGVVASKGPEDQGGRPTAVQSVMARPAVGFRNRNDLDEKCAIEIARPDQAQLVRSEAELREAIAGVINRLFSSAVVRAFDGEDMRISTVWRGKDKTIEQSVDEFRKNNTWLGRLLDDEGIAQMQAVEVFPLERIYAGADTREVLRDSSKLDAQRFRRDWSLGEGNGWGFGQSIVALRTHDQGGQFFSMILPEVNRQPLWALDTMPSPYIKPQAAPQMSEDSSAAHDMAPREEESHEAEQAPSAENAPAAAPAAAPAHQAPDTQASERAEPVMAEEAQDEISQKVAAGVRGIGFRRR